MCKKPDFLKMPQNFEILRNSDKSRNLNKLDTIPVRSHNIIMLTGLYSPLHVPVPFLINRIEIGLILYSDQNLGS